VRRGQDDDVTALLQLIDRNQARVADMRVAAEYLGGLEFQDLLELVGQGITRVVTIALERHAQDPHHPFPQGMTGLEFVYYEIGQAFIDQHGGMPQEEIVVIEGGQLHGVLEKTRPRGQTRPHESLGTGVVVAHGMVDTVKVQVVLLGDHVELVGNGELDIAPYIGEKLGQFRFQGIQNQDLVGEMPEQGGCLGNRFRIESAHDLGQFGQFTQGLAFRDSFRTETYMYLFAGCGDQRGQLFRGSRIEGASQDDHLAIHQVLHQFIDETVQGGIAWIEVFIHRSADNDNDIVAGTYESRVVARHQGAAGDLFKELVRSFLAKGHYSGVDLVHRFPIDIVDGYRKSPGGQGDCQGKADMAASTYHADFGLEFHWFTSMPGRPDRHVSRFSATITGSCIALPTPAAEGGERGAGEPCGVKGIRDIHLFMALVLIVLGLYLVDPANGIRGWDPLITACVTGRWGQVPGSNLFHFAHILVIPITLAFRLLTWFVDPLSTVTITESAFAALSSGLLFLTLRGLGSGRAYSFLGALTMPLCYGLWVGSTSGEEKSMALFAMSLFMFYYMRHLGITRTMEGSGEGGYPRTVLLGILMAVAILVHLVNLILVPVVMISMAYHHLILERKPRRLTDLVPLLGSAGLLVGISYLVVGMGFNHLRSISDYRTWIFQYHSGRISLFDIGASTGTLLEQTALGIWKTFLRPGLVGDPQPLLALAPWLLALVAAVMALSWWVTFRHGSKDLAVLALAFTAIHAAHFSRYEPYHWESWINLLFFMLLIPLYALWVFPFGGRDEPARDQSSPARTDRRQFQAIRLVVAAVMVLILALANGGLLWSDNRYNLNQEIVSRVQAVLGKQGILLQNYAFLEHYFILNPGPQTIIWGNLYPDGKRKLESLSIYWTPYSATFYQSAETVGSLNRRIREGTPVFFMCVNHPLAEAYYRQFMKLSRLASIAVPRSRNPGAPSADFALYRIQALLEHPRVTLPDPER